MTDSQRNLFASTWYALSAVGACDAIGGMEYQRVLREWEQAGFPVDLEEFIRRRANIGPEDRGLLSRGHAERLAEYIVQWLRTRNGAELKDAFDNMRMGDYVNLHDELVLILLHGGKPPNWT